MFASFRRWRDARTQVREDASALIGRYGDPAYYVARDHARDAGKAGDRLAQRHWSRVALQIAAEMGHVIGEKAADRYEADRRKQAPNLPQG